MSRRENNTGNIICIRANGVVEVLPADEDVFEQAKYLLSGAHLESVPTLIPYLFMLADEDGKSKILPINWTATGFMLSGVLGANEIVGDVVLVDKRKAEFAALKNSGYVEKVLKFMLGEESAS